MRFKPDIALRDKYIKSYWRKTRQALAASRQGVIDALDYGIDPGRLKDQLPYLMNDKPMRNNLISIWGSVGGNFAIDTEIAFGIRKNEYNELESKIKLIGVRGADPVKRKTYWQERMARYAAERSLEKTKMIMSTHEQAINKVIDDVISEANERALSVPATRDLLKEKLTGDLLTTIENYQAERIARTECNSAANTASFTVAKENAEGIKKEWWMSSYNVKHRESHIEYEALGEVELDYDYAPGLQFPGDPDCEDGGEVINCMCTYVMTDFEG